MRQELQRTLTPVRRRLTLVRGGPQLARALQLGSLLAIGLGVLRLATTGWTPAWLVWLTLGIAALAGLVAAWRRRASLVDAATRVDRQYDWKDTLTTAWHISNQPQPTSIQRLVLERARPLLDSVSARRVVPLHLERRLAGAATLVLVAVAISLCPLISLPARSVPPAPSLPPGAVTMVPMPTAPPSLSPPQVMDSLDAFRLSEAGREVREGSLAMPQDHVIVGDYFRRVLSGEEPSSE